MKKVLSLLTVALAIIFTFALACSDDSDAEPGYCKNHPQRQGCWTPPPPPPAACGDKLDNDGDGLVDYPNDIGCTSATDTDETNIVEPPPPPPASCNQTVNTASAAQTAVNSASGGTVICLADGTYSTMTLDNRTATSRVTLKAVNPLGPKVTGMLVLGSHVGVDGLDIAVAANDCVRLIVARTDAAVLNSNIHDCGRDGIRWDRPLLDGSNETSNTLVRNSVIRNVGISNSSANSVTLRGDTATFEDNEFVGSRNDAVDLWGDGHQFIHNYIHDFSNSLGNHNDAFQTWGGSDDGFRGTPLTNLLIARNRIANITGSDSHGFMVEGPNSNFTIKSNTWYNIGSHALNLQPGQTNIQSLNNTYVNTGIVQYNSSVSGRIAGNIFVNVAPYWLSSCTCTTDYNLATTWTPSEAHGLRVDPMFVSSTDFHLRSGSPAINSGDPNVTGRIDVDGKSQAGIVDRGAYEFVP